jgi:hypothetical protein
MMSSLPVESSKPRPRRKDAIIAAIATVLAAVIVASGTIISAGKRDRDSLRQEIMLLQEQIEVKSKQVVQLQTDITARTRQLAQIQQASSVVQNTPTTTTAAARSLAEANWPDSPIAQAESEGFVIGFYGCVRASGAVQCRLTVTNNKEERDFRLEAGEFNGGAINSRGIDDKGQQIPARQGSLAGGGEETNPRITVPSGVTIRGYVILPDTSTAMTEYVVLQIGFEARNSHRVEFRHVKLLS